MGFSKSKQRSESQSSNQAFPFLQDTLGGAVGSVGSSIDSIRALLSGDTSGFDAYKGATGFNDILSRGLQGVTNAGAAGGLLRSGSTGKALMNYGQELQQQSAQNYIQNLLGIGQMGLGAGQTIASAGPKSTSNQTSKSKGLQFNPPQWGG